MKRNYIITLMAHVVILYGCLSTIETEEDKPPLSKVNIGMTQAEVLRILSRPDFRTSSDGEIVFFYCTYLSNYDSQGTCVPVFFYDNKVVEIGKEDSQEWPHN